MKNLNSGFADDSAFVIAAGSDIGITRPVNQDGVYAAKIRSSAGDIAFACVCDGMGGLSHGELASATVVYAFKEWVRTYLPRILGAGTVNSDELKREWTELISNQNDLIRNYGEDEKISVGTTAVAVLLTKNAFYAVNVGDSRLYQIKRRAKRITRDHSAVQDEIDAGRMSKKEAETSPRRNELTMCIGVQEKVYPDFYVGKRKKNAVYMLCSDGFRHTVKEKEMAAVFSPKKIKNGDELTEKGESLIELNKSRNEKDNISFAAILSK